MEKTYKCANCPIRAKYDKKPKSLIGRFWRFHIKFCPGWKQYIKSLKENDLQAIKTKYSL